MARVQGSEFRVQEGPGARSQEPRACRVLSTWYPVLGTQYARCLILTVALTFLIAGLPRRGDSTESSFADRLSSLAAKCDDLGLKEQAEITRTWIIPRHPGRQYLFLLQASDRTAPKANAPENAKLWHKKFLELRRDRASELFAAAKTASEQKQPAKAYQLLNEVLREDPDHAEARRILGYVKSLSDWRLPDAEKNAVRQPPFDHPTLRWRARSYWSLETPHFQIVTNHSSREAIEAGQQLENLHALWRQIFFRYWSSPEALAARLAGGNEPLSRERPKMQVVVFKTRQEYAAQVAAAHPKAAATVGLYDDKQRIAYFFGGDTSVYPVWFHEATHQLFQQGIAGVRDEPGSQQNFWALEGAALYMESLAQHADYWTAGGCESDRLQFARYRVLSKDLDQPLARLNAYSREQIQNSDDIGRIYTQAAGLAHFLIDGERGQHREAFIDLLTAIYQGEDMAGTLSAATGQPLARLDEQYRVFLRVTDDDLAGIPDPTRLRNLSLCRAAVTDQGLSRFTGSKNLRWLDLSFSGATGDGLKPFAANTSLTQLFLEGTQITDASLPLIAGFKQLESLDLSRLPISDSGLAPLASSRGLKELFLTSCPLTDECLTHLRGLKQLERLDLEGTQITTDAQKRLRSALPKLK